jgi:NAD(P)-dependent dehydrogenase (short-subunit alcohol dehydrogenase family)
VFAERGATVVLSDWDKEGGERATADIRDTGARAEFVRCDVSNYLEVQEMFEYIRREFGRLDLAHNNAGVDIHRTKTADVTLEQWNRLLGINLFGVWYCMKEEIPLMLEGGGGSIVNTSSGAGLIGVAGGAPYVAAKHGVVGLTKSAALDYAKVNVRVNAVCPGLIETPLIIDALGDRVEQMKSTIPMGRIGKPVDVANTVAWLCSDEANYFTGQCLAMDGGAMVGHFDRDGG